jgi:hypothetical protein
MNKLSKEKRDRIILILIGGVGVAAGIWYFIMGPQKAAISDYRDRIEHTQEKLLRAERLTRRDLQIRADLEELRAKISAAEGQMIPAEQVEVSGKKWLLDQLNAFTQNRYDLTLRNLSDPTVGKQFLHLPGMVYSAAAYRVDLHGHYHEFGRFLADFENSFPYLSIQNLQVSPIATPMGAQTGFVDRLEGGFQNADDREKLIVSMRIVLLFRPGNVR